MTLASKEALPQLRDANDTMYEYFVEEKSGAWQRWQAREWIYHHESFKVCIYSVKQIGARVCGRDSVFSLSRMHGFAFDVVLRVMME
jgi:hypothetical protein